MAASFVHLQVSKEALKQAFFGNAHNQYRKVPDKLSHFVLLGSVAPDYPYLANKIAGVDPDVSWGDKLHNVRTTENVKIGLKYLRAEADMSTDAFMTKLAWLMGYYSHVMTDMVVHPVIYKLVGPYLGNPSGHAKYELYQDSLMCKLTARREITDYKYLAPLDKCSQFKMTMEFKADLNTIKGPVPEYWKKILKENYPDEYAEEEPDVDAWHRAFLQLIPAALKGKYIFGKLPIDSFLYSRTGDIPPDEKGKCFLKLTLPDNTTGDYKDAVFGKAVKLVAGGWDSMLTALTDTTAATGFNAGLGNWDLDDGTSDGLHFAFWPDGTTKRVA